MQVQLTDITPDAEQKIATAASICYDSKTDFESNNKRLKLLLNLKHLTTLRFANATFKISGISRTCTHQLVRTAHAGFLQRSQRYVDESGVQVVIPPSYEELSPQLSEEVLAHIHNAEKLYKALREAGIPKGDARFMLLEGSESSIYMTGNFQMWLEWLEKRTDKHAQWEIRETAIQIGKILAQHAPNVFEDYK